MRSLGLIDYALTNRDSFGLLANCGAALDGIASVDTGG